MMHLSANLKKKIVLNWLGHYNIKDALKTNKTKHQMSINSKEDNTNTSAPAPKPV